MIKYFSLLAFLSFTTIAISQNETSKKFYYVQHVSIDGNKFMSCSKEMATHYTKVDPEVKNKEYVTYYFLNGKKYMVEYYLGQNLQSRKTYHYNGKKCSVERRNLEVVGSAGSAYGNNVGLYIYTFNIKSAWDTLGNKTLKRGKGVVTEYDSLGNIIYSKTHKFKGVHSIAYNTKYYYKNGQLIIELKEGSFNYIFDENGDTLVKNGFGEVVSKYTNDSVFAEYTFKKGKVQENISYYFPNGQLKNKISPNGDFVYYYDNGQIRLSGEWKKNMKFGEWTWYDREGKVLDKKTFEEFDLFRDAQL